jgi:hypothetical protein
MDSREQIRLALAYWTSRSLQRCAHWPRNRPFRAGKLEKVDHFRESREILASAHWKRLNPHKQSIIIMTHVEWRIAI